MDIQTVNDLIEEIEEHGGEAVIKAQKKKPIPSTALRELYKNFPKEEEFLLFLAQYPLIPSDLADEIARKLKPTQTEIATALSSNPRSSQQTLNKLATKDNPAIHLALARNPNLTPREFQELVQNKDSFTRSALAVNPSLPSFLQFILANDSDTGVKLALASRPNLDLDVAIHLSYDKSPLVRSSVICNAEVEKELYQFWADQDDETNQLLILRRADANSQKTIIRSIRNSPHRVARHAALDIIGLDRYEMLSLAESDDIEDRVYLATKSKIPIALQRILAQDTSQKVRRRLASNDSLAPEIAQRIAASSDLEACAALAKSPSTDSETLATLCLHPDPSVATLVAYREDLNQGHWKMLINQRTDNAVAEHIAFQGIAYSDSALGPADRFAQSDNPSLKALAALSSNQSKENLARLAKDISPKVREAAASNDRIPESALQELCYDSVFDIAEAAEKNLARRRMPLSDQDATTDTTVQRFDPNPQRDKIFNKILGFFKE